MSELQIETWGYDESDVIPRKTFLLAQKIGGQVIGAFDSEISEPADGIRPKASSVSPCLCRGSRNRKRPAALSPLAHAGGARVAPQSRPWRATQMGTTA